MPLDLTASDEALYIVDFDKDMIHVNGEIHFLHDDTIEFTVEIDNIELNSDGNRVVKLMHPVKRTKPETANRGIIDDKES